MLREKVQMVDIDPELTRRAVNEGFSGGEKKRNENPPDGHARPPPWPCWTKPTPGLDIDALRIVSDGVNKLRRSDNAIVLVTHYQRILNYITPDFVHVLVGGRIVRSGGPELAHELEEKGYDWVREEVVS